MKKMHIILPNSVKISFGILCILFGSGASVFASSYESTLGDDYVKKGSKYYEQGLIGAQTYIDAHIDDDYWIGKKPKLANYGALFYTDDDTIPAYVEYKITCGKNDCGSVMVNLDGNDVLIPEGSTFGKATFENLTAISKAKKSRLYKFGILEQYSVGSNGEGVVGIDESKGVITYEKLSGLKKSMKEYKNSTQFQEKKKNIQNTATLIQPMVYTTLPTYTNMYIPGVSTANCPSRTPCYAQYTTSGACKVGCSPNALAILYGYYDRQGTKPNLVAGTATDISYTWNPAGAWFPVNSYIQSMTSSIASSMGTNSCGGTDPANIQNGKAYAISKGYTGTIATTGPLANASVTKTIVSQQVNAGRPVLLSSGGHTFVAYGYSTTSGNYWIRVNYGLTINQDTVYFGRDVDAASTSLPGVGGAFSSYITFIIQ